MHACSMLLWWCWRNEPSFKGAPSYHSVNRNSPERKVVGSSCVLCVVCVCSMQEEKKIKTQAGKIFVARTYDIRVSEVRKAKKRTSSMLGFMIPSIVRSRPPPRVSDVVAVLLLLLIIIYLLPVWKYFTVHCFCFKSYTSTYLGMYFEYYTPWVGCNGCHDWYVPGTR